MNREIWARRNFTNDNPIDYHCPTCQVGILTISSLDSKIIPGQEEMERYNYPYGIDYIFSGILTCKNTNCKSVISISGNVLKDIENSYQLPDGEYVENRFNEYNPRFFYPYLQIITLTKEIPIEVKEQIKLSFSHFFNDLSSCANRIRNSIEIILDDLKAPKRYKDKNNKIKPFRSLHHRIESYHKKSQNKKITNLLLAIKIIGNEGSHIGNVALEDILDAYEFLEKILDYVYLKKDKTIHLKASEIVSKNKPRSKN